MRCQFSIFVLEISSSESFKIHYWKLRIVETVYIWEEMEVAL